MSTANDTSELLVRASQLVKENNNKQAAQLLRGFLIAHPGDSKAWQLASYAYDTLDEQINAIEEAIKYSPFNDSAKNRLARLRSRRVVKPASFKQYALGLAATAVSSQPSGAFPPSDAASFLERGKQLADAQDYESAVSDFTQALTLDPHLDKAYRYRGLAYAKQNKVEAALVDYAEALRLNPQFAEAYQERATLRYFEKTDLYGAASDFEKAIQYETNNEMVIPLYQFKGLINRQLGYRAKAIADFSEVIRRDPQNAEGYLERAKSYDTDSNMSVADYETALRLDPGNKDASNLFRLALTMLGLKSAQQEDFSTAIRYLQRALELARQIDDQEAQHEIEELLRDCEDGSRMNAGANNKPSTIDFILHYWLAYFWLSIALAEILIGASLVLLKPPRGASPDVTPLIFIAVVIALYKSFRRGVRLSSEASGLEGKIVSWVFQIAVSAIVWPFAEAYWEIRFLLKAQNAWKLGQILVNDKKRPVRSA